jgi:hypothetical protein
MNKTGLQVKGVFRLQITEKDEKTGKNKIVGDTGWRKNQVTNVGIDAYLVDAIINNSPINVSHMALGTGSAPASNATSQDGEINHNANGRQSVTTSVISSRTAQFTGQFASANSFVTASANISNIGLWNTSTTEGGTLFAGNTFASSALATNQNVNATYQIRFTSA